MAVVGNLFVNISAKTTEFSKGIAGVAQQLRALPLVGKLAGVSLGGLLGLELFRIARLATFRFAETTQSIHNMTASFREFELSAARTVAPVVNSLTRIVEVDVVKWSKEGAGGVTKLGEALGFVGEAVATIYNGFKSLFQLMNIATGAAAVGVTAIGEGAENMLTFGRAGFSQTRERASMLAGNWNSFMGDWEDQGQSFGRTLEAGRTGKVDGKALSETGVMGSEERIMLARQQLQVLRNIEAKSGGVQ